MVRFGAGEKSRGIPIHVLANKPGDQLSSLIIILRKSPYSVRMQENVLAGCDVTSKIGTKSFKMNNNPEKFLEDFEIEEPSDADFKKAEHYLVNVIQQNSNCMTLEELRYEIYRVQRKVFLNRRQPLTRFMNT